MVLVVLARSEAHSGEPQRKADQGKRKGYSAEEKRRWRSADVWVYLREAVLPKRGYELPLPSDPEEKPRTEGKELRICPHPTSPGG